MAKERSTEDQALAPLPPLTNTERLWLLVRLTPGITISRLKEQAVSAGVPQGSVSTLLHQLREAKRLDRVLSAELHPLNRQPMFAFTAAGESKLPEVNEWLSRLPLPQAASAPEDLPSEKRPRLKWSNKENELVESYIAAQCVKLDRAPLIKDIETASRLADQGWRPHTKAWAHGLWMKKHREHVEAKIAALRAKPPVEPEPPPEPTVQAEAAPVEIAAAPSAPPPRELTLGEMLEQALTKTLQGIVQGAVDSLEQRLMAALSSVASAAPATVVPDYMTRLDKTKLPPPAPQQPPMAKAAPKKKVVIVVNALSEQFQAVQRAFPELDLRLSTDKCPNEQDPDLIIGMVKFMSHPLEAQIRKKYGMDKYVRVNGASDSVKQAIRGRFGIAYAH